MLFIIKAAKIYLNLKISNHYKPMIIPKKVKVFLNLMKMKIQFKLVRFNIKAKNLNSKKNNKPIITLS